MSKSSLEVTMEDLKDLPLAMKEYSKKEHDIVTDSDILLYVIENYCDNELRHVDYNKYGTKGFHLELMNTHECTVYVSDLLISLSSGGEYEKDKKKINSLIGLTNSITHTGQLNRNRIYYAIDVRGRNNTRYFDIVNKDAELVYESATFTRYYKGSLDLYGLLCHLKDKYNIKAQIRSQSIHFKLEELMITITNSFPAHLEGNLRQWFGELTYDNYIMNNRYICWGTGLVEIDIKSSERYTKQEIVYKFHRVEVMIEPSDCYRTSYSNQWKSVTEVLQGIHSIYGIHGKSYGVWFPETKKLYINNWSTEDSCYTKSMSIKSTDALYVGLCNYTIGKVIELIYVTRNNTTFNIGVKKFMKQEQTKTTISGLAGICTERLGLVPSNGIHFTSEVSKKPRTKLIISALSRITNDIDVIKQRIEKLAVK